MNDNQRAQKAYAREMSIKNGQGFGSYEGGNGYGNSKYLCEDGGMGPVERPGFSAISNKQNQHQKDM